MRIPLKFAAKPSNYQYFITLFSRINHEIMTDESKSTWLLLTSFLLASFLLASLLLVSLLSTPSQSWHIGVQKEERLRFYDGAISRKIIESIVQLTQFIIYILLAATAFRRHKIIPYIFDYKHFFFISANARAYNSS